MNSLDEEDRAHVASARAQLLRLRSSTNLSEKLAGIKVLLASIEPKTTGTRIESRLPLYEAKADVYNAVAVVKTRIEEGRAPDWHAAIQSFDQWLEAIP